MSFDPEKDDRVFGNMIDAFAIGLTIFAVALLLAIFVGCGTNKMKRDCVFVCPDMENIPQNCYCVNDFDSCK